VLGLVDFDECKGRGSVSAGTSCWTEIELAETLLLITFIIETHPRKRL